MFFPDTQKKEKNFSSVKKIATLEKINIAAINTEIEILKTKFVYRRKVIILQNLRRENAGEKPKFYITIEKNTPPVSKNERNLSRQKYFYLNDLKRIHRLSIVKLI
jgi:hypothetical protein